MCTLKPYYQHLMVFTLKTHTGNSQHEIPSITHNFIFMFVEKARLYHTKRTINQLKIAMQTHKRIGVLFTLWLLFVRKPSGPQEGNNH